jgi:ethanolamine ammonia-lyase small subunit
MTVDSYLTSRGGVCAMQVIVSYESYDQDVLDGWAESARQVISCQHAMGLSMKDAPRAIWQISE